MAFAGREDVLVLGLARGGVPVAFEVSRALNALLDVLVVRKLGTPGHEELAMGAIAPGGERLINPDVVRAYGISNDMIADIASREAENLARQRRLYRRDGPSPGISGRTVILVDDGLATGASMRVAIAAVRNQQPARIIVGVPVGAPETCDEFRLEVDETACVVTPDPFYAVGLWYEDFSQTTDQEVHEFLEEADREYTANAARRN
jgi:predicted phosphoribosyltransferase